MKSVKDLNVHISKIKLTLHFFPISLKCIKFKKSTAPPHAPGRTRNFAPPQPFGAGRGGAGRGAAGAGRQNTAEN